VARLHRRTSGRSLLHPPYLAIPPLEAPSVRLPCFMGGSHLEPKGGPIYHLLDQSDGHNRTESVDEGGLHPPARSHESPPAELDKSPTDAGAGYAQVATGIEAAASADGRLLNC